MVTARRDFARSEKCGDWKDRGDYLADAGADPRSHAPGNLIAAKPLVLDQTARGIGAVCGKLLVPIALVIGIGQRICMPLDGDAVGHAAELLCQ